MLPIRVVCLRRSRSRDHGQGQRMEVKKSAWEAPELIVLVRSRPEEAVLIACKQGGQFGSTGKCNDAVPCSLNAKS